MSGVSIGADVWTASDRVGKAEEFLRIRFAAWNVGQTGDN